MVKVRSIVGRFIVTSLYYIFRLFPINKKKIFVRNFYGKGYGDSPKYIINQLLKESNDYVIVWSVKSNSEFPNGIRIVNYASPRGLIKSIYEQVTAKVWIDNARKDRYERKRKGQYYIQTWHGDIGVKKIEGDCLEKIPILEIKNYYADSKMIDLFICGNIWFKEHIKERMFYYGEVATCGLPRRDILYSNDNNVNERILREVGVPKGSKILLYVPTFRDADFSNNQIGGYANSLDWNTVLQSLKERFGGVWYGLMRLHPNAAKHSKELKLPVNVINVTNYPDISELMCISDVCVSDYSSALFDFAVTKKPSFIYAPDKDKYIDERGYLFSDDELPFTVSTCIPELIDNISVFDEDNYKIRYESFYKDLIHLCENGHASEYITERIKDICEK